MNKQIADPVRVSLTGVTLLYLIQYAYGLRSVKQIQGGPAWAGDVRYDIEAKTASPAKPEIQHLMMRAALEERFRLKIHFEKRLTDVYFLRAPKGIQAGLNESAEPLEFSRVPLHSRKGDDLVFTYVEKAVTMAQLADWLWFRLSRPVLDETGLHGKFDFTLQMTADDAMGEDTQIENVQEQLGLKIVSGKGQIDTLIVDSASMPAEN